jgi:hypothetical protein
MQKLLTQNYSKNCFAISNLKSTFAQILKINNRMKKLIIVTIIAAFFAACNNTPAVNASTAKAAGLKTWVDSVKGLVSTATTYDSATWANWNGTYETEVAAINETELAEADKTTLAATKASWAEAGQMYTAGMEKAKAEAAAAAMATDSTTMAPPAVAPATTPEAAKKK